LVREVSVWDVHSGAVLARPIISAAGSILLSEGQKLTEQQIKKLRKLNIKTVYVRTEVTEQAAHAKEAALPEWTFPAGERTASAQTIEQKKVAQAVTEFLDSPRVKGLIAISYMEETFRRYARQMFQTIVSRPFLLEQLTTLYRTDLFLFNHSLNVAVTSGIVGLALKYDYDQLLELTIGAMLFDIGMSQLPEHLVKSTDTLTDWQRAKLASHPILGYQILISQQEVPKAAALCALQHHERFDGTGYPYRLKKAQIHPYAQIVAISDVYNALISPRHYRNAYSHQEAIEFLYAAGNKYFDLSLIKTFLKHICVYPESCKVLLSNGKIGVVAAKNIDTPHRPVVKVIREADGTPIDPPYEIDLKKHVDVVIVQVL